MSRGKTMLALLAVLVVLAGAVLAVKLLVPEETAQGEDSIPVYTMDPDTATALRWTYQQETVSLVKQDGVWANGEDRRFPLDSSYVDTMLQTLRKIDATRTLEDPEDLAEYGLDNPTCVVTVVTDTETTISIGNPAAIGNSRYLSLGDGKVYLVDETILDSFEYGLYDLVKMETIPDMSTVLGAEINAMGNKLSISYQENSGWAYSDRYVWFLNREDAHLPLDADLTAELLANVTDLNWVSCVEYNADAQTLEQYGLTMPQATVAIQYENSEGATATFALEIGNTTGDYNYARIAGSGMIYKIDGGILKALRYTTYYDLQPDEILMMDWDTVTGVTITLNDQVYEIQMETREEAREDNSTKTVTVALLDGREIDFARVENMLDVLVSTGYSGGAEPETSPVISMLFHRNTEIFPEVELAFYPYSSSDDLVSLNGVVNLFIAREDVETLVQRIEQILQAE